MRSAARWVVICVMMTGFAAGVEAATPNPVLVVSGGFNSCAEDADDNKTPVGTDRWNKAAALSQMYARGGELWVRSCFDKFGYLYYVTSQSPAVVQWTPVSDLGPFFQSILSLTANGENPLYVIGHSYGGWLAMYAAYWMPASVEVRRIFTVDPISPAHCTAAHYAQALASPSDAAQILVGCQRAPIDFTADHRAAIAARLPEGGWTHYYQRNFLPLRSGGYDDIIGPSHQYDVSAFLNGDGAHPSWNAHVGIDELSIVWYSFEVQMGLDLSNEP